MQIQTSLSIHPTVGSHEQEMFTNSGAVPTTQQNSKLIYRMKSLFTDHFLGTHFKKMFFLSFVILSSLFSNGYSQIQLFDNGPFVTNTGIGFGGADISVLENVTLGYGTFGFTVASPNFRLVEEFTNTQPWFVDYIDVYAYQTGSSTTSTFTGGFLKITSTDPSAGPAITEFGDFTTNRMVLTDWTNTYRTQESSGPLGNNRPIMRIRLQVNALIPAGTHYLEWTLIGSLGSGPFAPNVSILGVGNTGTSKQFNTTSYTGNLANGIYQIGIPFKVLGSTFVTSSVAPNSICVGGSVNVDFVDSVLRDPGNIYTLELSDTTGNFPGTLLTTTVNGPFQLSGLIPLGTVSGNAYKIRVVASSPSEFSSPLNLIINSNPSATTSATNAACNGFPNGSATAIPSGGTPPYSYSWSPSGGNGITALGLTAGTYTLTVTDASGCQGTASAIITQPQPFNVVSSQVNVSCNGGNNGSATVAVSGSTAPYTYLWSPSGGTAATESGLTAGNYSVLITDFNGCQSTQNFTITQPSTIVASAASQTNVSCNGGSNGAATVSVTGGTPGYSYNWNGTPIGDGTASVTGLSAGTHTVTVTDLNGCITTQSFTISEPTMLTSTASQSNVLCFGGNSGTATINVSGGTPTYTYLWSDGQTASTATGFAAGSYSVEATDANGCVTSQSYIITEPASPLNLTALSLTSNPCPGSAVGTASVNTATGGTGPYTYDWTPGAPTGDGTTSISGLSAGTYTATATDANGCTATQNFLISDNDSIAPNAIAQNITVYLSSLGSVSITGAQVDNGSNDTCGIASLNVSPNTFDCTNIGANAVTLTVVDVNGNSSTASATVTVLDTIAPVAIAQNITVQLDASGNVSITGLDINNASTDACGIFSYGVSPNSFTCANVGSNNVLLTVTDNNGNIDTVTAIVIVQDVTAPSITCPSTVTVSTDAGQCTASAVNLGSPSTADACGVLSTTNNAPLLFPTGNTTVTWTVTDVNGNTNTCTQTVTVNDTENPVIVCQNDTVICGSQAVNYAVPTFTDNCSISTSTPLALSQTTSSAITPLNSVSCNNGAGHTNNSYWRVFDLTAMGVTDDYTIADITFGVEQASSGSGSQPITLNVYSLAGTFNLGNLTLLTSENTIIPDQSGTTITSSLSSPPTVPANTTVVLELFTPDGQGSGSFFFIGSNTAPETGASYISTAACGIANPTPLANIGFANMRILLSMGGQVGTSSLNQTAGLSAGATFPVGTTTNTFVVTDLAGNTDTCSFNVTVNPIPVANVSNQVLCHNTMTSATSFGGVDTVYTWTNDDISIGIAASGTGEIPAFTATNTTPSPVTATITVTASYTNAGVTCTGNPTTYTITVNPNPSTTISQTNVSCNGFSDATATVVASGGTPGYNYSWSSGGTADLETGLAAGNYYVTVSDVNGCIAVGSVTITQPAQLVASFGAQTNVSCFAGNNGSATVNVSGGTAGYSYSWSPYGGTAATASGLIAGNYVVTVTDANGCIITQNFTITQPTILALLPQSNNVSCFGGSDGTASVAASGGTPGYSYSWSPSGGNAATANGLSAGAYTVTVTDSLGCIATQSFNITEPTQLVVITSATNVTCNGLLDGTATTSVSGGTAPYTYAWSTGITNASVSGLAAGAYTVIVTDAKGCTVTQSITVTQPAILVASIGTQTNVSCNGGSDGSATVGVTGGTLPYSYLWSDGQTSSTATGLSAGTYTVTATDSNGCTASTSVTITQPATLVASAAGQTNVSCNGGTNGSATVSATGGTGAYTYLWSNGQTSATATGLAAGTYSVTVTDANGCTAIQSFIISEPAQLVASNIGQTNVSCFGGNDGDATVGAVGGTGAYTYLWSNGQTGATATSLIAGTYTVTVTDANGCTATQSFTITEPTLLVATSSSQINNLCFNGTTGSATVTASGGTPGYTYLWSDGQTAATATGLIAGTYYVTVTDSKGCTDSTSFTITQPTQLTLSLYEDAVNCNGAMDGSAGVLPTGGTSGYTYLWSDGSTAATINNQFAGTYSVVVTDANGCSASGSITITQPAQFTITGTSTNVSCFGGSDGTASVSVSGATAPYTYIWSSGQTTPSISGLTAGVYTVTITDTNGCIIKQAYTITEPAQLVIAPSQTNVSCNGGSNGTASAVVTGGVGPYTYNWSNGATSASTSGLAAGTYILTVNDINGCSVTQSYTITEPAILVAGLGSQTNVSCNGGSDGSLTASQSGGTGPYTYLWFNGSTNATINGLSAGTYSVTVTDANGCFDSESFTITEPSQLTATATQMLIGCQGDAAGEAAVTASGGIGTYTYMWSNGSVNASANGLSAGSHVVTVTDANGCTATDTITIIENPTYSGLVQNDTICNGGFVTFGGNTYTNAGNYTFTFTTVNGCDSTVTLNLIVNPVYTGGTTSAVICQGDVFTFGGIGYTASGTYPHTFQTINGCDSTVTLFLFVNPASITTFNVTACDSYTFNGQTYTMSGTYSTLYQNIFTCDSTVTLNLTINPSYNHVQNSAICQGDDIFFGNNLYNTSGTFTHVFNAVNGCDSTVTMNLVVNPVYAGGVQNNTICDGDFVSFGGTNYTTTGNYTHTFQTVNGCDSTVTLNLIVNPVYAGGVQVSEICQGDNIIFGGTLYSATGMYTYTFPTVNGCDSTVTLDLTVNPVYAGGVQNSAICQGSSINFNGTLYATAGTYTEVFQTINGCDSTVTLNLSVNPTTVTLLSATACGSYTFNGQTYNASGTYTQPFTSISGCDSTVTLTLVINSAATPTTQNEAICQGSSFTFAGTVYTTTGTYTHTFYTANGCDSVVTLNLTVNPSYSGGLEIGTICDGDFYAFGGTNYTLAGTYPHTFQTIAGCDSIVTLKLNVNPTYAGGIQNEAICNGDSFTFGGTAYTTAGSYTHTFSTINNCDSVVTLNLIVNPVYAGGIQNTVICQGTTINFGGTLYGQSGTYTHIFATVNGCDSTVTMNLTVNPSTVTSLTATSCTSYTLNGQVYNASGTYSQLFSNVYGCDSTVTLNLIINPAYAGGVQNTSICQGSAFTFGGTAYTTSGSYTHTFQSIGGCDSIVTLNLTVNPSYSGGVQNTSICQGDVLAFGGSNYGTAGIYSHTFQTVNGCDSAVTLVLTVNPVYTGGVQNNTICQGQSVTFGGATYTATGSYPHVFTTINGCDSTVTLNLIVNPTYTGVQNSLICQGTSINFGGTSYTTAGTYVHTFQTINGCDSVVTINLTVKPSLITSLTATACTSYTLNGNVYTASGTYLQPFTTIYGCDSTVTLNLTITPAYVGGIQTASICQGSSFTFNGAVYTTSGSYTHTFNTINGCDSVVTLNLTVNPYYVGGTQNATICQGQSFTFGGTSHTTAGLHPHTFQTVNGCDSVVTLNLTVNPVYAGGIQNNTICQGQSVTFGGTAYTATGNYPHTFQTINGCDSTVTLHLIVNPTYVGGIQNSMICQGNSINFGGTVYNTTGTFTHTFQTVNGCDSTVTLNLTVKPTSAVALTANACTSYNFNGQILTASGTYVQQYTNIFGCDSSVTLNLNVYPAFAGGVQNNTICSGSAFAFGGSVYNQTGSYTHTFQTVNGCDSTVTLNLTVNQSYSGLVQTTILCQGQSVTFGGTTYTTTGVHTFTFQTVNGCDSTVTLALTVNPVYTSGVQNNTICQGQSVVFGGTAYTTTGSYAHTFATINGCDSTVTLNLIVNPTYVGTQNSTICDGSTITFGGTVYTDAGSYVHVFQTINGCDSTVTMNLSVNPVSATSLSATACVSYTLNGQTYTQTGDYTQQFTNVFGCDSIVTLNLTINQPTGSTITATACGSYTLNGQTYTQTGTYLQSFIGNLGCDSTVTLIVTVNHVNVGVTQSGNVLTADLSGATYQWINCTTGMPIPGETDQSLTVKVNGTYAVVITDGNCTDTSACTTVSNVGINDVVVIDMNVFPNPNEGEFTIQLGATYTKIDVEMYDMNGKLIMRRQFFNTDVMYISESLASGVYQVRVKADNNYTVKTIIRK